MPRSEQISNPGETTVTTMFEGFPATRNGAGGRRALVVADSLTGEGMATRAAAHAGVIVADTVAFDDAVRALDDHVQIDLLMIEAGATSAERLDDVLPRLRELAGRDRTAIIVALDDGQIDIVARHLLTSGAQLLCDPRIEERVAAMVISGVGGPALHDATREAESARLRRLNDEVARIADTLARLTRPGSAADSVGDRTAGYRAQPAIVAEAAGVQASVVRNAIRARRLRGQFFDPALFADPAWDMLLDLFAARLEKVGVSVSSLCIAAAVPSTTALRWIGTMTDAGLLERQDDPLDRRRAFITLSAKAFDGMCRYADAIGKAGLGFA